MQLLSLVKSLRDTGQFTAVSVTRPFEFEGQRKVEAADRMIAALEGAAHLVVVVEQVTTPIFVITFGKIHRIHPMNRLHCAAPHVACSGYNILHTSKNANACIVAVILS